MGASALSVLFWAKYTLLDGHSRFVYKQFQSEVAHSDGRNDCAYQLLILASGIAWGKRPSFTMVPRLQKEQHHSYAKISV